MEIGWEVGTEARELDNKPIKERMKIEGRSIKRVIYAIIFYSLTMLFFFLFL